MPVKTIKGMTPLVGEGSFVAETAAVIGNVTIGKECSIWYGAVVRGDDNPIKIGDRTNVQDCAVIHVSEGADGFTTIGSNVTIGHNATVHAARIADRCLIGMGATVLDGTVIEEGGVVAAGALVLGRTHIGPRELWGGVPAKLIKTLSPEDVTRIIDNGVQSYVDWTRIYRNS